MSVNVNKKDRYETKTVTFDNPQRAESYMVMMTAFEGTGHQTLEQYGYNGKYVMFVVETGGKVIAEYDPYKVYDEIGSSDLEEFLDLVRSGYRTDGDRGMDWENIEDGDVYHPDMS